MRRQTDISVIGVHRLQDKKMILSDPSAERALLSTICQYGDEVFLEVNDLISDTTFTVDSNKIIYQCLKHVLEQNSKITIDIGILYSAAKDLGLDHILQKKRRGSAS